MAANKVTTVVDDKVKSFQTIQEGESVVDENVVWLLAVAFLQMIVLTSFSAYDHLDIKKLYTQKQDLLSQFNENTLVKGVSAVS